MRDARDTTEEATIRATRHCHTAAGAGAASIPGTQAPQSTPRCLRRQWYYTVGLERHAVAVVGSPSKQRGGFKLSSGRAEADLLGALAHFSYFDRWSDEQRRDCCHRAHIRQYEPDQTVFVEGQAPVNYAHFVLSGECGLLQCLRLVRHRDPRTDAIRYRLTRALPIEDEITRFHRRRQRRLLLAADREAEDGTNSEQQQTPPPPAAGSQDEEDDVECSRSHEATGTGQSAEHHFFDLATYSRGSVFGIGEHMVDRVVFARSRVQCLLIPRYWLLEKQQNRGNVWHRIRIFLEQRQPSRDRLFRHFLLELRWQRYRRQLVDDHVAVHAPRHLPQLRDVPLVCRIEEYDVEPNASRR